MKRKLLSAICLMALTGFSTSCSDEIEVPQVPQNPQPHQGITLIAGMPEVTENTNARTELGKDENGNLVPFWRFDDVLTMHYTMPDGTSKEAIFSIRPDGSPRKGIFTQKGDRNTPVTTEWMETSNPVVLYAPSDNHFTDPEHPENVYDASTGLLKDVKFTRPITDTEFMPDGTVQFVVKPFSSNQMVLRNQFDSRSDFLLSERVNTDGLSKDEHTLSLKLHRLTSLIRLKIVDKTTDKILTGQEVIGASLRVTSQDPLVCGFDLNTIDRSISKHLEGNEGKQIVSEIRVILDHGMSPGPVIPVPGPGPIPGPGPHPVPVPVPGPGPVPGPVPVPGPGPHPVPVPVPGPGPVTAPLYPGLAGPREVPSIYTLGTDDCIYLNSLPAKLVAGDKIEVEIHTHRDYTYAKSLELTSEFSFQSATIHTLTVEMTDNEMTHQPQATEVKGNNLYVNQPGTLSAMDVSKFLDNCATLGQPNHMLARVEGVLNAADLKLLNEGIQNNRDKIILDLSKVRLEGGILETGMLTGSVPFKGLKLPSNLTTIKQGSILSNGGITFPTSVKTIESNALLQTYGEGQKVDIKGLTVLCAPSKGITETSFFTLENHEETYLELNEQWKNDPQLNLENKTWFGHPYGDICLVKLDALGNIKDQPSVTRQDISGKNFIEISLSKAGTLHPSKLIDALTGCKSYDLLISSNINGADLGRLIHYIQIYGKQSQEINLIINGKLLHDHGASFTSGILGRTITIPKDDALPAHAFSGSKYLNSIQLILYLTEIGDEAFTDCSRLTNLDFLYQSLEKVGDNVLTVSKDVPEFCLQLEGSYKAGLKSPITDAESAKKIILHLDESWLTAPEGDAAVGNVWKGLTYKKIVFHNNDPKPVA